MHIRVRAFHADGRPKFARPMWLYWTGPPDMDWLTFWRAYLKRFCIESVHQFTKNALVWTAARLGDNEREEPWTRLVMLAHWQLLAAAPCAHDAHRPWHKPMPHGRLPTPARVQRDYGRIAAAVGTPARPSKPRGMSPGRPLGYRPARDHAFSSWSKPKIHPVLPCVGNLRSSTEEIRYAPRTDCRSQTLCERKSVDEPWSSVQLQSP
jgi:hypothetical protein